METIVYGVLGVCFLLLIGGLFKVYILDPLKERRIKRQEKITSKLAGKNFVVIIRQPDKRKTGIESILINELLSHKVIVKHLKESEIEALLRDSDISFLPENTFIAIGTAWEVEGMEYNCDIRVRNSSNKNDIIAAIAFSRVFMKERLAEFISEEIAGVFNPS